MDISIIIARIFATVYFTFGVGFFLSPNFYKTHVQKLLSNTTFLLLSGFLAIVFGVLITSTHHYWENDWRMIITIFGWVILIKGILLIIAPSYAKTFNDNILNPKYYTSRVAPLLLIIGLFFGCLGFLIT